ncbi:MAG: hypothetical protein HRT87_08610 [Legionellales bacterium]|nr:hypothetical protein [Legionellales bacterium]
MKMLSEYNNSNRDNIIFKDKRVVIGGCARNVQKHLPYVFSNIVKICNLFKDCQIIMYHDKSKKDNTLQYLRDYQSAFGIRFELINHPDYVSRYRTHRLAFGRSRIVETVENKFSDFDLFVNIDLDEVSSGEMNIDNFIKTVLLEDKYDVVSFARSDGYYDIWALRYGNFMVNQHDISKDGDVVLKHIQNNRQDILENLAKLSINEFFEVESAFNGLAIYKIPKIIGCRYNGENILYKAVKGKNKKEDCEHVYFHKCLKEKNKAKIVISPRKIF